MRVKSEYIAISTAYPNVVATSPMNYGFTDSGIEKAANMEENRQIWKQNKNLVYL